MGTSNCLSIKQALIEHLAAQIDVQEMRNLCVVTLPLATIDQRWVDVFVEPRVADYFWIHDGGKAVNELILQGMKITNAVERGFEVIASRFGVSYSDEMFQTGAKFGGVASGSYAVGMCSALAMTQLLEHSAAVAEEPIEVEIGGFLKKWGKRRARVQEKVSVLGEIKQHEFDYVLHVPKRPPVSVSVLHPTAGSLSAAERFGFKTKDLANTEFGAWKRLAVETRSDDWSQESRKIVQKCADLIIEIPTDGHPTYEQIGTAMDQLAS
jgi:hypothetical protein